MTRSTCATGASPHLAMLQRWRSIAFEFDRCRDIDSYMNNTAHAAVLIHIGCGDLVRTRRQQR